MVLLVREVVPSLWATEQASGCISAPQSGSAFESVPMPMLMARQRKHKCIVEGQV